MTIQYAAHRIARLDIECPDCDKTGDVDMTDDIRPMVEALESVIDALERITGEVA